MAKKKYEHASAIAMIQKNGGRITLPHKKMMLGTEVKIQGSVSHRLPGIKVLGAIDYLVNKHGYRFAR